MDSKLADKAKENIQKDRKSGEKSPNKLIQTVIHDNENQFVEDEKPTMWSSISKHHLKHAHLALKFLRVP